MWRKPTIDDLRAKLSSAEIDAFSQDDTEAGTPAETLVAQTSDCVRGYVKSGRKCQMCPDAGTLPQMLIGPAMDYAAFDLLKRLDLPVSEPRTKAREAAEKLFEKIAEGAIVPEDYGEEPAAESKIAATPGFSNPMPERMLD